MPFNNTREVTHMQIDGIWIDCSVRESHGMTAQCTQFPVEDGPNISDHVRTQPETLHIEGIVTNTPIEAPKSHAGSDVLMSTSYPLLDRDGRAILTTSDTFKTYPIEGEPVAGWLSVLPFVGQVYDLSRAASDPRTPKKKLQMAVTEPQGIRNNMSMQALQMVVAPTITSTPLGPSDANAVGSSFDRVAAVAAALRDTYARRKAVQVVTAYRVYNNAVLVELTVTRDASSSANALMFTAQCQMVNIVGVTYGSPVPTQVRATPAKAKGTQNTQPTKPGEVSPDLKRKVGFIKQGFTALRDRLTGVAPAP